MSESRIWSPILLACIMHILLNGCSVFKLYIKISDCVRILQAGSRDRHALVLQLVKEEHGV